MYKYLYIYTYTMKETDTKTVRFLAHYDLSSLRSQQCELSSNSS